MQRLSKLVLTVAVSVLALFASSGIAQAHVTVDAPTAVQGGTDTVVTFRVPTESDTASTTGLRVQLPTTTPLLGVLVEPIPGWTYKITTSKLPTPVQTDDGPVTEAVSEIDWATTGSGIGPGGFGEFNIIVGQLPRTASLTFKAIQHYSDNTDVSWVEVAAPGSAEPDHPAPTLPLAAAPATPAAGPTVTASPASASTVTASPVTAKGASTGSVTVAIILGAIGIALGAAGLLLGLTSRRRPSE